MSRGTAKLAEVEKNGTMKIWAFRTVWMVCLCLAAASCRHKVTAVVPVAPTGGPIVIPAGTVLAVIAAEAIDSGPTATDHPFAAVISRDIKQGDPQKLLPSGSPATLVLLPASGNGLQTWRLGLSSVMVNGDSYLVRDNGQSGMEIGTYLGGVTGTDFSDPPTRRPDGPNGLIVSESLVHILPGSLLTFRLQREITLTGSGH